MLSQRDVCVAFLANVAWGLPIAAGQTDSRQPAEDRRAAATFSPKEDAFLERVQQACFLFFWREVGSPAKLVKDRLKSPVSSAAAVGFQLSSLPIGVERGWITRQEGQERAATVLRSLLERSDNKKWGIYLHFPDHNNGGLSSSGYEVVASTIDTALLIAGAIPAAEYFGGDVARSAERMLREANWHAFATATGGFISMGWRPKDVSSLEGDGEFLFWHWYNASDEERLIYLLACGSPEAAHRVPAELYYRLSRPIRQHEDMAPFVVSWPGALFTYFFSHCWVDYRGLGVDQPARFGVTAPGIDWFENSRRAILVHVERCRKEAGRYRTLAEGRWGLSACAGRDGYIVPELQPNLSGADRWFDGTVAPYAAGSSIVFLPRESLAALQAIFELRDDTGKRLVWRDPSDGGYGFVDAFNLDQPYVSDDYVGIDLGPMLLAIENARSGLIWRLFMRNAWVRESLRTLRLVDN